jgi:hypothetical protein
MNRHVSISFDLLRARQPEGMSRGGVAGLFNATKRHVGVRLDRATGPRTFEEGRG